MTKTMKSISVAYPTLASITSVNSSTDMDHQTPALNINNDDTDTTGTENGCLSVSFCIHSFVSHALLSFDGGKDHGQAVKPLTPVLASRSASTATKTIAEISPGANIASDIEKTSVSGGKPRQQPKAALQYSLKWYLER